MNTGRGMAHGGLPGQMPRNAFDISLRLIEFTALRVDLAASTCGAIRETGTNWAFPLSSSSRRSTSSESLSFPSRTWPPSCCLYRSMAADRKLNRDRGRYEDVP